LFRYQPLTSFIAKTAAFDPAFFCDIDLPKRKDLNVFGDILYFDRIGTDVGRIIAILKIK